jgi:heme/copper-type cytochrome/quinol oxidase subunit 4
MNDTTDTNTDKVVYLRPPPRANALARREAVRRMIEGAGTAIRHARRASGSVLTFLLLASWQIVRVCICALLVLIEPLLRITLVPLAFLGFVVTLIFGFMMGSPGFPRWGMLAFSVGLILVYWLFLGLMSLFMRLPPDHDRYR